MIKINDGTGEISWNTGEPLKINKGENEPDICCFDFSYRFKSRPEDSACIIEQVVDDIVADKCKENIFEEVIRRIEKHCYLVEEEHTAWYKEKGSVKYRLKYNPKIKVDYKFNQLWSTKTKPSEAIAENVKDCIRRLYPYCFKKGRLAYMGDNPREWAEKEGVKRAMQASLREKNKPMSVKLSEELIRKNKRIITMAINAVWSDDYDEVRLLGDNVICKWMKEQFDVEGGVLLDLREVAKAVHKRRVDTIILREDYIEKIISEGKYDGNW